MKFVITSIFDPTPAVRRFSEIYPGDLIVVGDRKTPRGWRLDGAVYIGPEDHEQVLPWSRYADVAPYNHYARKNIGYLAAMVEGQAIGESDDDNMPYIGYEFPPFVGRIRTVTHHSEVILNQYSWFTDRKIWPRGLPPRRFLTSGRDFHDADSQMLDVEVGLWQGLADGDPDVDAIYRLTDNTPCEFERRESLAMLGPATAPTNSQNTAWNPKMYEAMYLPGTVSFRYTDILRGLVASAVANRMGLAVGFLHATVSQERNPHDYVKDFESEIPVYLTAETAYLAARDAATDCTEAADMMRSIYTRLRDINIVEEGEIDLLDAWLSDVAQVRQS